MKQIKIICLIIAILLTLTFFVSCSSTTQPAQESESPSSEAEPSASNPLPSAEPLDFSDLYIGTDYNTIRELLLSYGQTDELYRDLAIAKGMFVVDEGKILSGKEHWDAFEKSVSEEKDAAVILVQYAPHNDPILNYLCYTKDGGIYVLRDESRDLWDEDGDKYREFHHDTMKTYTSGKYTYQVLLNDPSLTWDDLLLKMSGTNQENISSFTVLFSLNNES